MRNNKGISMITLIITIIVMIILAAIAFMAAGDQVGSAQFSKFASEFGEYATNFENAPLAEVTEALGLTGKATNKAQKIYAAARDVDLKNFDSILNGVIVPGGYTSARFQTDIKDSTGATVELASSTTPVYEIKSDVMKEYDGKKFYGDANGKETHWVTAKGTVFTLPGFPRVVDGEERMYITPDLYYIENSGNMITADDLVPIEPQKVGGDVSTGSQVATDAADNVTSGEGEEEEDDAVSFASIKSGDYIAYTPDTPASVQWRVWKTNGSSVVIIPTSPVGILEIGASSWQNTLNEHKNIATKIEAICDNYTNSELGITEAKVRSLTKEDLEDPTVSTLATQKLSYVTSENIRYNEVRTYTSRNYYAAKYNEATGKNDISSSFLSATEANPLKLKQTSYSSSNPGWKTLSEQTPETYGELLGNTISWLPSTAVNCMVDKASFRTETVSAEGFNWCSVVWISAERDGCSYMYADFGVRPLVTLSSSSLAIDTENPGDGSASAPWNIVKK